MFFLTHLRGLCILEVCCACLHIVVFRFVMELIGKHLTKQEEGTSRQLSRFSG